MENRFSKRLSQLMKERKISGQKIGAAVGKSQKTISRYANGETEPSVEMKNKIYQAIADLSGYEEDALTEEELQFQEILQDWEFGEYEIEIGKQMENKKMEREKNLLESFKKLTIGAKQYYIDNFDVFHKIEDWEDWLLDTYKGLSSDKQNYLIKELEKSELSISIIEDNEKIAGYTKMILKSKKRPYVLVDDEIDTENLSKREEILLEEYYTKSYELDFQSQELDLFQCESPLYEPRFLKYTKEDWYFLLRVQIFEAYDDERWLWDEEVGIFLGPKLGHLLDTVIDISKDNKK